MTFHDSLTRVAMRQGKVREIKFFQGQGIVRVFCELSGKFENIGKCQDYRGILEKEKNKKNEMQCHILNDFNIN